MIELTFHEVSDPYGVSVEFYHESTGYREAYTTLGYDLERDNGKQFFDNMKYALTQLAMYLADMQDKLAEADRKDAEKAIREYISQNAPSSFRTVSLATAELVHGIVPSYPSTASGVLIDIEPYDVTVGKNMSKLGTTKFATFKDYRINFLDTNADSQNHGPGTKLILEDLQKAADAIEEWYANRFSRATAGKLHAANQADARLPEKIGPKGQSLRGEIVGKGHLIMHTQETEQNYLGKFDPVNQLKEYLDGNQIVPVDGLKELNVKYETKLSRENADKLIRKISKTSQPELRYVKIGDYMAEGWLLQESGGQIMAVPVKGLDYSMEYSISGDEVLNICRGEISTSGSQVVEEITLASSRSANSKNPAYWAHALEDKVNGVLQQMKQNLPEDDSTRSLAAQISDLLSDHIYAMGKEEPSQ